MGIDLDKLGMDRDALTKLLRDGGPGIKIRLGNGKIIDLLKEHLDGGLPIDDPDAAVDDHDKVGVRVDDHDRVRSLHTKQGRLAPDATLDDLVRFRDGVFIGDMDEAELARLEELAADVLKNRDLVIVRKLLNESGDK